MTIAGIQYLRALAALAVVVYHAAHGAPFAHAGHRGVDVFFVISGFIVTYTTRDVAHTLDHASAARAFFARRLVRIVPLYWLATLVSVVLRARHAPSAASLLLDLAFVAHPHARMTGHCYPFLVPGWSLNFEVFFYAVFALCIWRARPHALWAALAMSACAALGSVVPLSGVARFYLAPFGAEFSLGIVICLAHERVGLRPPRALGALLALLGAVLLFRPHPNQQSADALWAALLVYGAIYGFQRVSLPRVALLGDASYAIYLVHTEVVSALRSLVLVPLDMADATNSRGLLGLALAVVSAAWVGVIVHRRVERPLNVLVKRWLTEQQLSRAAGT